MTTAKQHTLRRLLICLAGLAYVPVASAFTHSTELAIASPTEGMPTAASTQRKAAKKASGEKSSSQIGKPDQLISSSTGWISAFKRVNDDDNALLLGNLPATLSMENGNLDVIGGKSIIEISMPDSLSKFIDAVPVEQLTLTQAIREASEFSRDIKIAQSRMDQAEYQSRQARGLLLPSLALRNGRGNETSSPASVLDPVTGSTKLRDRHLRKDETIFLRQPLFDAPSFLDWQRRDALVDSREGALRGSEGDTYVSTIQAYLNVSTTLLLTDLYKEYEQQLNLLLNYVSQRATAGASSEADMERVRARSLTAKSARLEQESAYSASIIDFVRLTNLAPKTMRLPRRQEASDEVPTTYDEGVNQSLENNPELRALKAEMEAAEKDIMAARARYLPRVDFELSDSKVTNAGGPTGLQHDQRAMVVMNWNLLNGSTDYFNLREKQERRVEIAWRLDDQQRRLKQTLSAQYATLESTRARLAAGYREWGAIYSAARSMTQRMLSGNQSLLDLLDVLDRVQQARARLINLHAIEILSLAQISRLIGKLPAPGKAETSLQPALVGKPGGA